MSIRFLYITCTILIALSLSCSQGSRLTVEKGSDGNIAAAAGDTEIQDIIEDSEQYKAADPEEILADIEANSVNYGITTAEGEEELEELLDDIDSEIPSEDVEYEPSPNAYVADHELLDEGNYENNAPELPDVAGGIVLQNLSQNLELIPEGWPDYIPVISNCRVRYGAFDENAMTVVAYGDITGEDVRNYYESLPGWELYSDAIPGEMGQDADMVQEIITFALVRNGEMLTIIIFEQEDDTFFQLELTWL